MKKFKLLILVLMVGIFAMPAFSQKLDTFGYYTIERPAKEFADISEIHLAGDYGAKQSPSILGLIRLKKKNAKDFRLRKTLLNGRNYSFTSETVAGVYYTFFGTFDKSFPASYQTRMDDPVSGTVLSGKLVKYQGKKKIAEANVKFSYATGD